MIKVIGLKTKPNKNTRKKLLDKNICTNLRDISGSNVQRRIIKGIEFQF